MTDFIPSDQELNSMARVLHNAPFARLTDIERERVMQHTIAAVQSFRLGMLVEIFAATSGEVERIA